MRFVEGGPDIPAELIEARDRGEVVFFCGAGVSLPAGLPDFDGLARRILGHLGARQACAAYDRAESLDRVFSALVKEFGGTQVDRAIARALRAPRNVDLRHHRAILDLARGPDGNVRIVTTNFDALFERADPSLDRFVPPVLPDLGVLEPLAGLVYLHGRLAPAQAHARVGYVISSGDFGRAYLAEGWAARFVRALRERYTIVLLGYSANDPPMRYLLEGLSSREGADYATHIYAFAPEGAAVDEEEWRDKGVTRIGYREQDSAHSGLWDSLAAWAQAAREPDRWSERLQALAQAPPETLAPYERGQVAHFLTTVAGARSFALATPPPPASWLAVMDGFLRYAEPFDRSWGDATRIDPLELYGLDRDPPRLPRAPAGGFTPAGEDFLRWRPGDDAWPARQRISGYQLEWSNQLPPRLFHLAAWVAKVMDQPAAIWWAAGNPMPHPGLVRELRNRMDRPDMAEPVRHFWRCWLDAARTLQDDLHDLRRYELAERIAQEGWNNAVLRELERIIEPSFEVVRTSLHRSLPTQLSWDDLPLRHIVEIKVKVTSWDERLAIPDDKLAAVIAIFRRSLARMAQLLGESTTIFWQTPTLHPTGERGESRHHGRKAEHFVRFASLFDQLANHDEKAARQEIEQWDSADPWLFAKLFLYAASRPDLVVPALFARRLAEMPNETFWESGHQRELLFALRAQWPALSHAQQRRIERRIVALAPPYDGVSRKEFRLRASARSASMLRWLELHGRTLTPTGSAQLARLAKVYPAWDDSWAWQADHSHGPWGGMVEKVTEPQGLETLRANEILAAARTLSTDDHRALRDYRPFEGLVDAAPAKALAALRIAARASDYPRDFWNGLIENWPEHASARQTLLLVYTLVALPDAMFETLRFGVARLAEKALAHLPDQAKALAAYDAIVGRYAGGDATWLNSGIHETTQFGDKLVRSQFSTSKAINSPAGALCEALFDLMGPRSVQGPMPSAFADRLDALLMLPGDGAGHAACVIARRLSWLEYWHADWVARLMPRFALSDRIAPGLWHGIVMDKHVLSAKSERRLRPSLLALLRGEANWLVDDRERHALLSRLVWMTLGRRGRQLPYHETRDVLMAISDNDRAHALHPLVMAMEKEDVWASQVRPFLVHAWPQQLALQSGETSRVMLQIVEKSGKHFPHAVATVLPFLRPVAQLDIFAYRLRREGSTSADLARHFPDALLDLLGAVAALANSTYGLAELLDAMAQAVPRLRQDSRWRRLRGVGP